jgi:hypothetical protein
MTYFVGVTFSNRKSPSLFLSLGVISPKKTTIYDWKQIKKGKFPLKILGILWAKLSLIYQAVKMRNDFKNLIELLDYFKEEKTCQEFLAHQIWDEGKAVCPHCNA